MAFNTPQIVVDGAVSVAGNTIRQQIVTRIELALREIRTANSFKSDAGLNVWPWRSIPFKENELPAIILRDLDEPIIRDSKYPQRHRRTLHIQIEIVCQGTASPAQYREILADVEQALRSGYDEESQFWWGDLAYDVQPRISRMVLAQESYKIAGGFYECFVDYVTRAFDQYEQ